MYAALIRASQTWHRVVISEFELKQIEELKNDLDSEFKQRTNRGQATVRVENAGCAVRNAGVAVDARGGLLVADDVGNSIWRVTATGRTRR